METILFANITISEKKEIFEKLTDQLKQPAVAIEKDWWVVNEYSDEIGSSSILVKAVFFH